MSSTTARSRSTINARVISPDLLSSRAVLPLELIGRNWIFSIHFVLLGKTHRAHLDGGESRVLQIHRCNTAELSIRGEEKRRRREGRTSRVPSSHQETQECSLPSIICRFSCSPAWPRVSKPSARRRPFTVKDESARSCNSNRDSCYARPSSGLVIA